MTTPEAVKKCSDIWEKGFGKRIEDIDFNDIKDILSKLQPSPFNNSDRYIGRLTEKLREFN